jgi:glutamate/tyrosine decarboxylase-like PLP-dependent enzyme
MREFLHTTADHAADFLESLSQRKVGVVVTPEELFAILDRPLAVNPVAPVDVISDLVRDIDHGLIASSGPNYFGFVIGGATPVSVAADWLTTVWDQNAQVYATSPGAAVVEEIVARWLIELLQLPSGSSVGFVTGCQMAHFTALSAARNTVLSRTNWDVEQKGLFGAPPISVFMSDQAHSTVKSALQMIGIGRDHIHLLPSDSQGRMQLSVLQEQITEASGRPMIVSVQAGNVNTGAFEAIGDIADLMVGQNGWLHVDGAFGLWAAVSPRLRHLVQDLERADSWATDAHKWLNVPYDSGIVISKHPAAHRGLKTECCSYVGADVEGQRDGSMWTPENSRRARALVLYAVIRSLGRSGIRHLIERCCDRSLQFADEASRLPNAHILNEVVLNQILLRFEPPNIHSTDAFHESIATAVQKSGLCWLGATRWKDQTALRISVSNWSTDSSAITQAVQAIRAVVEAMTAKSALSV